MPFVHNFFFLTSGKKIRYIFLSDDSISITRKLYSRSIFQFAQNPFFLHSTARFTIQQYSVPVHVSESCEDRSNNKNHLFPDVNTFDDGFVFKFEVPSFIAPLLLLGQLGNVRAGSVARFS